MTRKIFISHRSTEKEIADNIETFLTSCGLSYDCIFCSSLPGNDVKSHISKEVKDNLKLSILNIVILSDEFYKSPYCQNEAGIIWFLDVDKVIIALPEIDENLMEGFLDREHKIRRLNNKNDILAICDAIRIHFPELVSSHTKINANIDKLIKQYEKAIDSRINTTIEDSIKHNLNELADRILCNDFSDGELVVLKFFYDKQILFIADDLLELNNWLIENNINNIQCFESMQILVEDGLIEYISDIFERPSEFKLVMSTFRNLRKLPNEAVKILEQCFQSHIINKTTESKSNNEIDRLIDKGFTEEEIILIKYLLDIDRSNLFSGWQAESEIKMIKNWEQINDLSNKLSGHYSDALIKLEMRKFIEPCAQTSYGNTKEYRVKKNFSDSIKKLNASSIQKITEIIDKYKINNLEDAELPF